MKRIVNGARIEKFFAQEFPDGFRDKEVIDKDNLVELLSEYRKFKLPGEAAVDKILHGTKRGFWGTMEWFFRQVHYTSMFSRSYVRYKFLNSVRHQPAVDIAIDQVKEDIEFRYDLEMIYGKIMSGSYSNTKYEESSDWFKKNNIDWKVLSRRSRIGSKLSEALRSEEFRRLVDAYGLITIDMKEKDRAFDAVLNFIILHRNNVV